MFDVFTIKSAKTSKVNKQNFWCYRKKIVISRWSTIDWIDNFCVKM